MHVNLYSNFSSSSFLDLVFQSNLPPAVCSNHRGVHQLANTLHTSNNIDASVYGNCTKHFKCKGVIRLHSIIFSLLHIQLFPVVQKVFVCEPAGYVSARAPQHYALHKAGKGTSHHATKGTLASTFTQRNKQSKPTASHVSQNSSQHYALNRAWKGKSQWLH